MTVTLRSNGEPRIEIESFEKNPDKITFGSISDGRNRLELCSYDKIYAHEGFIFLNGERIMMDKYQWRKLMSLTSKMGHFFGFMKRKKAKK